MKVLFIEVVSEMGGAQQSLYELCTALPSFGVEAAAAVPQGPLHEALRLAGVRVYPIPAVRARRHGLGAILSVFKLLYASRQVSRIIRACKPDIVHANSVVSALAAQNTPPGIPLFLHIRDLRLPAFAMRKAAKRSTRIIAISAIVDAFLRVTLDSPHLEKIRIIRNGIDTARFTPGDKAAARKRFALPGDAPVIGMAAHLIPWKGHALFLSAAGMIRAKYPAAHFVIAGRDLFNEHGAYVKQLHGQANKAGLQGYAHWVQHAHSVIAGPDLFNEHGAYARQLHGQTCKAGLQGCVHWIQDVDKTEQIYPALDVLIHPAKREPFGRVVCEAMAMRVPVVALNSGGIPDIITDEVNGLLVQEDDAQGIAERVSALLGDPTLARTLAYAAREHILQHFSKERVARQLAEEYEGK